MPSQTPPAPRPWILAMCGALVMLGLLSRLAVAYRSPEGLSIVPLQDDSYYTQSYARKIWHGQLFSLNERHQGNAFHPLYPFLCAPLHGLSRDDRVLGIRFVVVLNVVLFSIALWLAWRVFNRLAGEDSSHRAAALIGVGLYSVNCIAFRSDLNLMQTGLQLALIWALLDATIWLYQKDDKKFRDFGVVGAVAGLACLARIDTGLLIFGYGISLLWQWKEWKLTWPRFFAVTGPAFCAVAGWSLVSYYFLGTVVPTGGASTMAWTLPSVTRIGRAAAVASLLAVGFPHSHPENSFWSAWWTGHPWARPLLAMLLFGALLLFLSRGVRTSRASFSQTLRPLLPVACGVSILFVTYVAASRATFFFERYFTVALPLIACFWFLLLARAAASGKWRRIAGFVALYTVVFVYFQYRVLRLDESYLWTAFAAVTDLATEEDWIASAESGLLGYYHDRTINLDGKTNVEALRARRNERLLEYLTDSDAIYLVDGWGWMFTTDVARTPIATDPEFQKQWEMLRDGPYVWRRRSSTARIDTALPAR